MASSFQSGKLYKLLPKSRGRYFYLYPDQYHWATDDTPYADLVESMPVVLILEEYSETERVRILWKDKTCWIVTHGIKFEEVK